MSMAALSPDIPLLPRRAGEERPLLVIMAIMACLASLTLLFSLTGFRTSQNWQADNARALTVQILPDDGSENHILEASDIIKKILPGAQVTPIGAREARKLLGPWIGDVDLPEDLPLPILLKVKAATPREADLNTLKMAFSRAKIETIIDDHSRWRENIRKTWQTVQVAMWGIIMLVMAASAAIIYYATRSVLRSRQTIINVLIHVGAPDRYIVRLFTQRFFSLGLKAAIIGALSALLGIILFSARTKTMAADILPHTGLHLTDMVWLAGLISGFALLSGLTAIFTTRALIRKDRQTS